MRDLPGIEKIPLPTPFPVGRVNVYLLRGDPLTLIDTGVASSRSLDELAGQLAARSLDLRDIEVIVLTHGHYDHAGAAPEIARLSGAVIHCHEAAARSRSGQEKAAFSRLLRDSGAPERVLAGFEKAMSFGASFGEPLAGAPGLRFIQDGQMIRLCGMDLLALHTPGHSPGHLCLADQEHQLVFCGDLLLQDITPNPLPHFDPGRSRGRVPSLPLYLGSLDRIEALGSVKGLTGHGGDLEDTAVVARRNREHVSQRATRVLAACHENPGVTPFALALGLFRPRDPGDLALAFSETIAYLDLLEEQQRIKLRPGAGVELLAGPSKLGRAQ